MPQPFFPPCTFFTWLFCLVLTALTVAAACTDLRSMTIPKALTVPTLLLGVGFNVVRGAWLGAVSESSGAGWGGLNGLLFALAGFAVGFGLFFVLWILGTCHGGDVKLFAALGAWVGPLLAVGLLLLTVVIVASFSMGRFGWRLLHGHAPAAGTNGDRRARQRLVYSPSLVLATVLLLSWVFRAELYGDWLR
jgi:prepilin peptidase CpaA